MTMQQPWWRRSHSTWRPVLLAMLLVAVAMSWPDLRYHPLYFASPPWLRIVFAMAAHVTVFALLGVTLMHALSRIVQHSATLTFLALTALAFLGEWQQEFIPGRGWEGGDLAENILGAAFGIVIYRGWSRGRANTLKPRPPETLP